jgi:hypothetical protein
MQVQQQRMNISELFLQIVRLNRSDEIEPSFTSADLGPFIIPCKTPSDTGENLETSLVVPCFCSPVMLDDLDKQPCTDYHRGG